MSYNLPDILELNKQRNAILDAEFDPISGIGSLIPRKLLSYTGEGIKLDYFAPESMFEHETIQRLSELGSIEKLVVDIFGEYSKARHEQITNELFNVRLDHDFEFYAFTCVKITPKTGEVLIPFKLNYPQRKVLFRFEKMRLANKPIRAIIEKARQWGGSTLTQIYENWIQLRHKKMWNMAICTLVEAQAIHIRQMLSTTIENFPPSAGKFTMSNYGGFNTKNKYINERNCIIGVGSTERPDNLRTYNYHLMHLSEVALWKDTPAKSAQALAQSLRGSIRNLPYTMIVLESTPKGIGNFFYDEWQSAIEGRSSYDPIFVPWWEIEMYRENLLDENKFIDWLMTSVTKEGEYARFLWGLGATLEGINWYFNYKRNENLSDLGMFAEFPSTSEEGFTSTGRPAFNIIHIKKQYQHCRPPVFVGDIHGKSTKGKEAFEGIEFVKQERGNLLIWEYPDETKVSNRYCGFLDIGGKGDKADYSCLKVFDRYFMIDGGIPEVVAMWWGHLDPDLLAWKCAQIMYIYGKGLFAVEIQSLLRDSVDTDGVHSLTVLDEIAPYYPNLYARTSVESIRPGAPTLWGFHTNTVTKPMIIDTMNECLRDDLYYERDKGSLDEMQYFELKDNGTYGAAEKKHDDKVISTAGGLWLAIKYMPRPAEIIERTRTTGRRIVNESTI